MFMKTTLLLLITCCHQNKIAISIFLTRDRHIIIQKYHTSQNCFQLPKTKSRNFATIIYLFKQTLEDIVLFLHDIAGLDVSIQDGKQFCREPGESEYGYLQIDRFAKRGEIKNALRNCEKTTYTECTHEMKTLWIS